MTIIIISYNIIVNINSRLGTLAWQIAFSAFLTSFSLSPFNGIVVMVRHSSTGSLDVGERAVEVYTQNSFLCVTEDLTVK
jgi:hypothetical protein